MMKSNHAIQAFSIIEAIISMAITAIIMSIIFVIFSIVTERMIDYKNQNRLINDLNRITYAINKDIFENEKMILLDTQLTFNGYEGKVVKYNFLEDYTLRIKETFIDTFKIKLKRIAIDSVKSESERKIFQKLKVNIEVNEKSMDLNFYKNVFPNELLKNIKQ